MSLPINFCRVPFAECFSLFALCRRHTTKLPFPVVDVNVTEGGGQEIEKKNVACSPPIEDLMGGSRN